MSEDRLKKGTLSTRPSDAQRKAINNLVKAVRDEGPRPDHHKLIMLRHREQWPTLWEAIDQLIAEAESAKPDMHDRWLIDMTLAVKKEAPNATDEQIRETVLKLWDLSIECAEEIKTYRLNKNMNTDN